MIVVVVVVEVGMEVVVVVVVVAVEVADTSPCEVMIGRSTIASHWCPSQVAE